MLKVAVLDDYQRVAQKYGDWSTLTGKIKLRVFNTFIQNEKDLVDKLKQFDVVCLMRERTKLPETVINKLPNLKLVVTSGMWNPSVDGNALKNKNIIFSGTDNQFHSTAELSWILTMIVWRGIKKELNNINNGHWQTEIGNSLYGKTLGVFGLGRQGKQVANFGRAFGMKVLAWSHNLTNEICQKEKVIYASKEYFFKNVDILSIHIKLSERTKNIINLDIINQMKKSSIIINTSRGPILNENDLIYAIRNKLIFGAGLDVYDVEPLPKNHVFRKLSKNYNLVLTPHIGYVSNETYTKFHQGYVLAVKGFIDDKPINVLN